MANDGSFTVTVKEMSTTSSRPPPPPPPAVVWEKRLPAGMALKRSPWMVAAAEPLTAEAKPFTSTVVGTVQTGWILYTLDREDPLHIG